MKKFLYCAAVVALATACTQEDDLLNNAPSSQAQGQGLTFEATLANNNVGTKGELYEDNKTYPFFWYAEQDRIDVMGINLNAVNPSYVDETADSGNKDSKGIATQSGGAWTLPTNAAAYKATQSQGQGRFTAASDADMLELQTIEATDDAAAINSKTATIVATYGGVKASAVTSKVAQGAVVPGELASLVLETTGSNVEQTVDRPNQVWAPMWSVSSASRDDNYSSVGEKVNLELKRPFPVLRFTTTGVDKFAKDFGALESVTLVTRQKDNAGEWKAAGSTIAYATGKEYTVIGDKVGFEDGWEFVNSNPQYRHKVTVRINSTEDWSDDNSVYMTVAPVDRSELEDGEMLMVTYEFANITFTLDGSKEGAKPFETLISKSNWTASTADGRPNAVTKITPLDINNYNYLVVNRSDGKKTLIINKGKVADVFNTTKDKVVWGEEASYPALADIKKIVVNCDIEDADFANLNLFEDVKVLELAEETSIPAGGLKSFANVESLSMPKVTTIDPAFLGAIGTEAFNALEKLNMASYNFPTTDINEKFFNTDTKGTLETLDMSGIEDMTAAWPLTRTINFDGYALIEVTVQDGVQLSPNAFANCAALTTINGVVKLMDNASATAAFKGATSLQEVNVANANIPDEAFNGAIAIESILLNGKQVAPTTVGKKAFKEAAALKYMDLSKATVIGEEAFNKTGLTSDNKDSKILTVGVAAIERDAFSETDVEYVYFQNAETIKGNIFYGVTSLKQVKFGKAFEVADVQAWAEPFGKTPAQTDLFLVEEMRGGDYWAAGSNNLTLPKVDKDGKPDTPVTIGFRVIKVDDGSFGN